MRLYVEVARATYARISTYRSATVAGVFTNTVFGFLLAYVLLAVYAAAARRGRLRRRRRRHLHLRGPGHAHGARACSATPRWPTASPPATSSSTSSGPTTTRPGGRASATARRRTTRSSGASRRSSLGALVFDLRLPSPVGRGGLPRAASPSPSGWPSAGATCCSSPPSGCSTSAAPTSSGGWPPSSSPAPSCPIVFFPVWLETVCRVLPFASMLQLPVEVWLGQHDGAELARGVRASRSAWVGGPRAGGPLRDGPGRAPGGGAGWLRPWRRSGCGGAWSARAIRADWQYRTSFFLFLLSQTLVACLDLAVIASIFSQVDSLGGWSGHGGGAALRPERGGLRAGRPPRSARWRPPRSHIKAGTFDLFLLRPLPPLLHLSASEFALRRIGRVLQPLVVLVAGAGARRRSTGAPRRCVLVPVTIVSGTVIFGSVWVVTSSIVVLDGREPGGRQRLHLRRGPGHAVPDRRARRWLRRLAHLPRAARLRRLLPGRPDARPGRPARPARAPSPGRRPLVALASVLVAPRRLAARRPPPPEHRELSAVDDPIIDVAGPGQDLHRATARPAASGAAARRSRPSPASTCRSSGAPWSATSAPTAPGSPRRSRCSPASSCRPPGHVRVDGLEPSRQRTELAAPHRRGVRPALPAVVGPAAARQLRPAPPRLPGAGRAPRRQPRPLRRGPRPRPAARRARAPALARPADARRADRRPAARPVASSCSTSPPSASTSSARRRCGSSSSASTRSRAPRCCSPPTT